MRENMKRRLAVFLSILFVLPAVVSILPQTADTAQAAEYVSMFWVGGKISGNSTSITVEAGQKFYIGDYLSVYTSNTWVTGTMVKAAYSSGKASVATVNSKGYVNAKKVGTATIKVKYKNITKTCKLKVVKKGSFGTNSNYEGLKKAADKIAKLPSNITTANCYNWIKKRADYNTAAGSYYSDISSYGFIQESYNSTEKLAVPKAGRINTLSYMLDQYNRKNSPLSTMSSKVAEIKSVKATPTKLTIQLKKPITKAHILAMKVNYYSYPEQNKTAGNNKVYFQMTLRGKKATDYRTVIACMEKGKKTITAVPDKQYDLTKKKYVTLKLKKGATYALGTKSDWTKGKTVKVK